MTASQAKKELMRRALEIDPTVHVGKNGVDENLNNEVVQIGRASCRERV